MVTTPLSLGEKPGVLRATSEGQAKSQPRLALTPFDTPPLVLTQGRPFELTTPEVDNSCLDRKEGLDTGVVDGPRGVLLPLSHCKAQTYPLFLSRLRAPEPAFLHAQTRPLGSAVGSEHPVTLLVAKGLTQCMGGALSHEAQARWGQATPLLARPLSLGEHPRGKRVRSFSRGFGSHIWTLACLGASYGAKAREAGTGVDIRYPLVPHGDHQGNL